MIVNSALPFYKKLSYKASHRGSKELDLLLGNFVSFFYNIHPGEEDLETLEKFLEEEDPVLLDYFLGRQKLPSYVSEFFKNRFLSYQTHFVLEKNSNSLINSYKV